MLADWMPNRDFLVDWQGRRDKAVEIGTVTAETGRMICLTIGHLKHEERTKSLFILWLKFLNILVGCSQLNFYLRLLVLWMCTRQAFYVSSKTNSLPCPMIRSPQHIGSAPFTFDWRLLSFDQTEGYLYFIISGWLHIFSLKIQMCWNILLITTYNKPF